MFPVLLVNPRYLVNACGCISAATAKIRSTSPSLFSHRLKLEHDDSRRVLVVNLGLPHALRIKLGDRVSEFQKDRIEVRVHKNSLIEGANSR